MKKLFTSVLLVLSALTMQAKESYTGNLNVVVDALKLSVNQEANITVKEQPNGKYELIIKNFLFANDGDVMNVGTVDVTDVDYVKSGSFKNLKYEGETLIKANEDGSGDLQGVPVGIKLNALLDDENLGANITITALGMDIQVNFTPQGAYIPNSDFENFHKAKYETLFTTYTTEEADHWHSFTSAKAETGYGIARQQEQSFKSTDVRENSYSKTCLLIKSAKPLGVPANGTVTTGRLHAGSTTPSDPANHAYLNLSNTETDDLGDPFYTTLSTMPDAIEFWCRFKQGQDNLSSKYASMRAVITDGTYYQDPEDKTYTNIVGVAANKAIEGTDVWQKVTAKFDYESYAENGKDPKAILVTISTNSEPGVASKDKENPDYIYIDDLSLIYNANLTSLKFKGQELFEAGKTEYTVNATGSVSIDDIEIDSDGIGAYESVSLEEVEGGSKATITITSEDLKTQNVYVLNIKGATPTKIDAPKSINLKSGTKAIYNLAGQKVANMNQAGVYIIEHTDGSTVKVLKK